MASIQLSNLLRRPGRLDDFLDRLDEDRDDPPLIDPDLAAVAWRVHRAAALAETFPPVRRRPVVLAPVYARQPTRRIG